MKHRGWRWLVAVWLLAVGMSSCIDEDLSKCGKEYKVKYEVKLQTELKTMLETQLETELEERLGRKLMEALKNVFTDQAKDIEMLFYTEDSLLNYSEHHVINANNASYTIFLPVQNYQHMTLANDDQEEEVYQRIEKKGVDFAPRLRWEQAAKDTLDSHEIGLFTARLKMEVKDEDQLFSVKMYMQNAAQALVIYADTVKYQSLRGVVGRLADGFAVRDSLYSYHDRTQVRLKDLGDTGSDSLACLYGVSFPSRDLPYAPAPETKGNGGAATQEKGAIWNYQVFVTLPDGKITKTTLYVKSALKAGAMKIVKVRLLPDGSLVPLNDQEVGASVELDWKEGAEFNPEI